MWSFKKLASVGALPPPPPVATDFSLGSDAKFVQTLADDILVPRFVAFSCTLPWSPHQLEWMEKTEFGTNIGRE
jgi:hypothetical protein